MLFSVEYLPIILVVYIQRRKVTMVDPFYSNENAKKVGEAWISSPKVK